MISESYTAGAFPLDGPHVPLASQEGAQEASSLLAPVACMAVCGI